MAWLAVATILALLVGRITSVAEAHIDAQRGVPAAWNLAGADDQRLPLRVSAWRISSSGGWIGPTVAVPATQVG